MLKALAAIRRVKATAPGGLKGAIVAMRNNLLSAQAVGGGGETVRYLTMALAEGMAALDTVSPPAPSDVILYPTPSGCFVSTPVGFDVSTLSPSNPYVTRADGSVTEWWYAQHIGTKSGRQIHLLACQGSVAVVHAKAVFAALIEGRPTPELIEVNLCEHTDTSLTAPQSSTSDPSRAGS